METATKPNTTLETDDVRDQHLIEELAAAKQKLVEMKNDDAPQAQIAEQEATVKALLAPGLAATHRLGEHLAATSIFNQNVAIADAEAKVAVAQLVLDMAQAELRRLRLDLAEHIRHQEHRRNELHRQRAAL